MALRDQSLRQYPAGADDEIVLWDQPDGVRCVMKPYDEARYHLHLLRGDGTIKSDLFADYSQALAASRDWQKELLIVHVGR
jgi:hypothetical protein